MSECSTKNHHTFIHLESVGNKHLFGCKKCHVRFIKFLIYPKQITSTIDCEDEK